MNDNRGRGLNSLVSMIFVIVLLSVFLFTNGQMNQRERELTYNEFVEYVEKGNVKAVEINQNKNVPTGNLQVQLKDDEEIKLLYVSDINEVQKLLQKEDVTYYLSDVPQDSWFATTLFPTILTIGAIFFLFMLMNRQGGGANAKAMNFGKSRARMSTDKDKKITFKIYKYLSFK